MILLEIAILFDTALDRGKIIFMLCYDFPQNNIYKC